MSYIDYEVTDRIAVITLDRPETRNSQDRAFLTELDDAWREAERDNDVRVIVVKANGPHFSSGHDWNEPRDSFMAHERAEESPGIALEYETEADIYFGVSRRWRDVPKPSIAAVQGGCIAAGLMLAWPCDIIIASEDAWFSDPVAFIGIAGVEYHGHTWEFGPRKAKELLFTGGRITADEARGLGMVNRVVPRDQLVERTMELASQIAAQEPFVMSQVKRSVNTTLDIMGQHAALDAVFNIHWTSHAHKKLGGGGGGFKEIQTALKAG